MLVQREDAYTAGFLLAEPDRVHEARRVVVDAEVPFIGGGATRIVRRSFARRERERGLPDCLLRDVGVGSLSRGTPERAGNGVEHSPERFLADSPLLGARYSRRPSVMRAAQDRVDRLALGASPRPIDTITGGGSMRSMLMVLATAVSMALLTCGVAAASITLFEPPLFHLGPSTDRAASAASPGRALHLARFRRVTQTQPQDSTTKRLCANGLDSWRLLGSDSSRCVCRTSVGTVSSSTRRIPHREPVQVGEQRRNKVFIAEFAFMSKTPAYQPGLFLSVSPDSGEGSRMSWVGLEDTQDGIQVSAADTPEVDGEFVDYDLARCLRTARPAHDQVLDQGQPGPGQRPGANRCRRSSTVVSASRRGRTTTAPLRSRRRRRTSIRQRTSTACSSAPACRGPLPSPAVVATCSTT